MLLGLAVAAAVLALAEGALRVAGVAGREPLLVERTDALGRRWGLGNEAVGANWFRGPEWEEQIRHPRAIRVPAEKPAGTLRVFVIGESAAYGTPWPDNAAWPAMLGAALAAGGSRPVEVHNAGIRASSLDIQPALVEELREGWSPDLFVLYAGHNEVYGVRDPAGLARLSLFRLAQDLTRPAGDTAKIGLRADATHAPGTLGPVAERTARDLARLIAAAAPVPVMVVLPTSNERDLAPVGSWVEAGKEAEGARAAALVKQAALAPEQAPGLVGELRALEAALPDHAGLQYALGLAALGAGDATEGRRRLDAARELDTVPIRARADVVATLRAAPLVCDPEVELRAATPDGVLDHTVFLDHVHVSLVGGARLAEQVARCIGDTPSLGFPVRAEALPDLGGLAQALGLTAVDEVAGYAMAAGYFQRATVAASPSTARSVALLQARRESAAAALAPVEREGLARSGGQDPHAAVAALFPAGSPVRLAELRRAVAAAPSRGALHAALAEELALAGETRAAEEERAIAGMYAAEPTANTPAPR